MNMDTKARRNQFLNRKSSSLERQLLAYGAMVGVVVAATPEAAAQCTGGTLTGSVCVQEINLLSAGSTRNVDFDGDGDHELRIRGYASTSGPDDTGRILVDNDGGDGIIGAVGVDPTFLKKLGTTYSVAAGNNFETGTMFMFDDGAGQWQAGESGYIGVKFSLNGGTHYGWVGVTHHPTNRGAFTIGKAGYETTADTAIPAGDEGPLPVELVSFSAIRMPDAVLLSWDTASEANNAGFEIQMRRFAERDFSTLSFMAGKGSTLERTEYAHRIEGLALDNYVFRLKQVDFDGQFTYSKEIEVLVEGPDAYSLSRVYPNPFNPQAQFTLMVKSDQHVRAALHNAVGQEVKVVHDGSLSAGQAHQLSVDAADLPSGAYLLRVVGETFEATEKATLLK